MSQKAHRLRRGQRAETRPRPATRRFCAQAWSRKRARSRRIPFERGPDDLLNLWPLLRCRHGLPSSFAWSTTPSPHSNLVSRWTEKYPVPRAISSVASPPKNRNSTMRPCCSSRLAKIVQSVVERNHVAYSALAAGRARHRVRPCGPRHAWRRRGCAHSPPESAASGARATARKCARFSVSNGRWSSSLR